MKQSLLVLACASFALGMMAESSQAPVASWGKLIDGSTSAGDMATSVMVDNSGNVYWYGNYGSTESTPVVNYDGSPLFTGALYNAGTSYGNNYTLLKTDKDGNKLWCVYTDSGDFSNSSGCCSPTPDGGVITVSKVRHTDGMTDRNIIFHNADGTPFEIDWTCDRRYYRLAVTKISSEGMIEWNRMVDFSTEPGPAASGNYATFWADVFNVTGGTTDDEGNIYIALNYRNPMTVKTASGSSEVFTPVNTQTWNGDTQTVAGDFMVVSLDSNGYYRGNLSLEGECAASYCQKLEWADGRLFAQGYIVGKENATMKAGGIELSPSTIMSPLLIATDRDLNPIWAKCYKGEKVDGKNAIQNVGITPVKDALYICGQYNLKFSDPVNPEKYLSSTQGSIREGFVLKLDAATGEWLAARNSRDDDWNAPSAVAKTGLTGYFQIIPSTTCATSIFVFGYVMNAQVGVFLREYDSETLVAKLPEGQYNIVTNGGVPSCQAAALDQKTGSLYVNARGNKGFTLIGGDSTDAPVNWGTLAAKYELGEPILTVVNNIADDENAPVEYFTLEGIRIDAPVKGIYIRRQGSKVEKIIL